MATNPSSILRRVFPTARRLLLEKSLLKISGNHHRVLVVGAGADPYKGLFKSADLYISMDIDNNYGSLDVVADALNLPFPEEVFDCVVAIEVMEHVRDPWLFVEEVRRVIKPGGQLVLTVPFMFHIHGDPEDYWRPTESGLRFILRGFGDLKISRQGNRVHVIADLIFTAAWLRVLLFPFRILNHVVVALTHYWLKESDSSAPSGFLVIAEK